MHVRIACAADPESAPKVSSTFLLGELFCTPAPLGFPWFPEVLPRVPLRSLLAAFEWFVDLLGGLLPCLWIFGRPFDVPWAPLIILGCLLNALCISWVLLGPLLDILTFAWASP